MNKRYSFLLLLLPISLMAQFAVVSTTPANNAKNVPLTTRVSITFSEAIDTGYVQNHDETMFSNIDSSTAEGFSQDLKTMYADVVLKPNTTYFVAFIYMKAKSGATITTPYVFYFTTGSDFPPYTVSGTVSSGSTGVSPEGAIVGLASENIFEGQSEGPPPFVSWTNVNNDGTFSIPYVMNGTYWLIAAKDVDHDGSVNPEKGVDVLAFTEDSIVVNNASVSNVGLTFMSFTPKTLAEALPIAQSLSNSLPPDKQLKRVSGWWVDTLGRSMSWEFIYTANNNTVGYAIDVDVFGTRTSVIDSNYFYWLKNLRTLPDISSAASSSTVIANVEAAGGKAVRTQSHPGLDFRIEVSLADQNTSQYAHLVPDQNQFYWGVSYTWGYETIDHWEMISGQYFLCNFSTGNVIGSSTVSVRPEQSVPQSFELLQNYPNPFNPSTTIPFTVPSHGTATVKVFNVLGQEVATVFHGEVDAGRMYYARFDAGTNASGMYIARLEFNGKVLMRKMVLMK
ncbi:MAG: Ig-like domain-containing protein [Bacteroidota bacterium]